ncbi:hypothetical protein FNV43_RR00226 [Rhamnella rubrinervis]|uniref:Receptor-like serine/threonine-protein kinase n=1 Tax=Rhamnella rubrinervis TaxID=2594499 RepID=A0A8K0HMN5_9ROSA|nr:hypothetical protein FNV43_RR00226 [Rhamnella rubrinervis]
MVAIDCVAPWHLCAPLVTSNVNKEDEEEEKEENKVVTAMVMGKRKVMDSTLWHQRLGPPQHSYSLKSKVVLVHSSEVLSRILINLKIHRLGLHLKGPARFRICLETISITQPIRDGDGGGSVLVSSGEIFALGFFSPGKSNYRYLGIWYHKITEKSVVWVANRDNPINNTSGFLSIDTQGNLVLFDNNDQKVPVWSTNSSSLPTNEYAVAQLLDSGNLVLFQNESKHLLWQSFDYPTDTQLPNMKLGLDRRTGLNWFLTSWKSEDDPRIGNYTLRIDPAGSPQMFLYRGQVPLFRLGHWNGMRLSGFLVFTSDPVYYDSFVNNDKEISIIKRMDGNNSCQSPRSHVTNMDIAVHLVSVILTILPFLNALVLPGFEPKSPSEWNFRDGTHGCVRKPGSLICSKGEGFVKLENIKPPDTSKVVVINGLSLEACEKECLRSCNCTAYASANISEGGSGCLAWHGDLVDTRIFTPGGQDFYLRVDELELAQYTKKSKGSVATKGIRMIMVALGVIIFIIISFIAYWFAKMKRKGHRQLPLNANNTSGASPREEKLEESRTHPDLPFFEIRTLITATDDFSAKNMLGQGGFGSVYKGQLVNGQEIAVKRLSKHSGQGMHEFMNEVTVIAKLQHRNLRWVTRNSVSSAYQQRRVLAARAGMKVNPKLSSRAWWRCGPGETRHSTVFFRILTLNQLLEMKEKADSEGWSKCKTSFKAQVAEERLKEVEARAKATEKMNEELHKQMEELKARQDGMEASIFDKLRAEMRQHNEEARKLNPSWEDEDDEGNAQCAG